MKGRYMVDPNLFFTVCNKIYLDFTLTSFFLSDSGRVTEVQKQQEKKVEKEIEQRREQEEKRQWVEIKVPFINIFAPLIFCIGRDGY